MKIAASHPALPGHFPGHPVVPGVVLLDAVVEAMATEAGNAVRVTGFPSIKFLAPLAPETEFSVTCTVKRGGHASFDVQAGDTRLVTGTFTFDSVS